MFQKDLKSLTIMASAQDPKEPSFKSRLQAIIRDFYKLLEQEEQVI